MGETDNEFAAKILIAEYQEVCRYHQAITDFRAKLLALLPIASGAGIFLLLSDKAAGPYLLPIGLFGALVTIGLAIHEWDGIKRCGDILQLGAALEGKIRGLMDNHGARRLGDGQFTNLNKHYATSRFSGPPGAAKVIYFTVFVAWLYVAFAGSLGETPGPETASSGIGLTLNLPIPHSAPDTENHVS